MANYFLQVLNTALGRMQATQPGDGARIDGAFFIPEMATPTPIADVGAIYTKTDNNLYFQDGAGVEHQILTGATRSAELTLKGNAAPTVISTVDDTVGLVVPISGGVNGFAFVAGLTGAITDTADNGGVLRLTDASHGLDTGDVITVNGLATAAQNAATRVTVIDPNTIDCDDIAYATASETGVWERPSQLVAGVDAAGEYGIVHFDTLTASGTNKVYELAAMVNITEQTEGFAERKMTGATDTGTTGGVGHVALAAGDRVWMCIRGITDATDVTLKHFGFHLKAE